MKINAEADKKDEKPDGKKGTNVKGGKETAAEKKEKEAAQQSEAKQKE